jgi:hypothetical protein
MFAGLCPLPGQKESAPLKQLHPFFDEGCRSNGADGMKN